MSKGVREAFEKIYCILLKFLWRHGRGEGGGGGGKDILSFFKDVQFENKKMRILAQNS